MAATGSATGKPVKCREIMKLQGARMTRMETEGQVTIN